MSEQPNVPTLDAVETFVASLRQRAVPLNTIKSYAHDFQVFIQAMCLHQSTKRPPPKTATQK